MATYVLINTTFAAGKKWLAGSAIDDQLQPSAQIVAAGGYLYPTGTPEIDAAGTLARSLHSLRALNEEALTAIMVMAFLRTLKSVSGKSVASATSLALEATGTPGAFANGAQVFVATFKSWFVLDTSSTATVDGATVIAAAGGGRWLRLLNYAHPSWAVVADWYINATTGNDENDGSSASPLKTWAELARRCGAGNVLNPPVNLGARKMWTVHLMTSLPTSDAIAGTFILGFNVHCEVRGGVSAVLLSGSFTAVTSRNGASNVPWQVTDSALPLANSWTAAVGSRIRITSGTNQDVMFAVMKDLGSKQARVSEPVLISRFNPANATTWPGAIALFNAGKTPVVSDTYAVETLFSSNIGSLTIIPVDDNSNGGVANNRWFFTEVNVQNSDFALSYRKRTDNLFVFNSCLFSGFVTSSPALISYIGCIFLKGIFVTEGTHVFYAGMMGTGSSAIGLVVRDGRASVDFDMMFQGCGINGIGMSVFQAGIFDCPTIGGLIVGVSYITYYGSAGSVSAMNGNGTVARIWGSGNAGAGIYVDSGSILNYRAGALAGMTITGSTPGTNDLVLAGRTTGRAWDESGGAWSPARTLSWANVAAALGSSGLAGQPVDVATGARLAICA